MKQIKCVLVGDIDCDKTKLLICYSTNSFSEQYISTVFDNYSTNVKVEDQPINLQLWDTSSQEEYKRTRSLSYTQTDVFVILFSLVNPASLENVEKIWLPEIKRYCPETPFILVGTKSNLRDEFNLHESEFIEKGWHPVSYEEGNRMKNKIGAQSYIECDILKHYNITEVFESAIKAVLHYHVETSEEIKSKLKKEKKEKKRLQKEEKKRKRQKKKEEKQKKKTERKEKKKQKKINKSKNKKKLNVEFKVNISLKISYK